MALPCLRCTLVVLVAMRLWIQQGNRTTSFVTERKADLERFLNRYQRIKSMVIVCGSALGVVIVGVEYSHRSLNGSIIRSKEKESTQSE
jgi:hypothetical protein